MREIIYKPSGQDKSFAITRPNATVALIQARKSTFLLKNGGDDTLVFAFRSRALGDFLQLHPSLWAKEVQFIQLHSIKPGISLGKEIRLILADNDLLLLNERDEIYIQSKFRASLISAQIITRPSKIWQIEDDGFISKIRLTQRLAHSVEQMAVGGNIQQILSSFWLDYRVALGDPDMASGYNRKITIHGEFGVFTAKPYQDGNVLFDLLS